MEIKPERPGEEYLGDSTTVRMEGGVAILAHDFPDGRRHEIQLDPAVLDEFLAWIEDLDPPAWRGVQYIPRPRCEHCRWWKSREAQEVAGFVGTDPGFGLCEIGDGRSEKVGSIYGDGVQTAPGFGCTEWESREERK